MFHPLLSNADTIRFENQRKRNFGVRRGLDLKSSSSLSHDDERVPRVPRARAATILASTLGSLMMSPNSHIHNSSPLFSTCFDRSIFKVSTTFFYSLQVSKKQIFRWSRLVNQIVVSITSMDQDRLRIVFSARFQAVKPYSNLFSGRFFLKGIQYVYPRCVCVKEWKCERWR